MLGGREWRGLNKHIEIERGEVDCGGSSSRGGGGGGGGGAAAADKHSLNQPLEWYSSIAKTFVAKPNRHILITLDGGRI